jgi:hypothetical protein
VLWIVHLEPSQASTNAMPELEPEPWNTFPTAVQAFVEVHETSFSSISVPPLGVGVLWIVQLEPSQASANGMPTP